MEIYNERLKNRTIVTSFGKFSFNADGVTEIPGEHVEKILSIRGCRLVEEKTSASNDVYGDKSSEQVTTPVDVKEHHTDEEGARIKQNTSNIKNSTPKATYTAKELEAKNVLQLRKIANEYGITLTSSKKADIIPVILGYLGAE